MLAEQLSQYNQRRYQPEHICSRCVMDDSDSQITFDTAGVCDHCHTFDTQIVPNWDFGERGHRQLSAQMDTIKRAGEKRDFDCIMGMSGGLDSSYMLHKVVKDYGLRPLVFHVDGGWNSELAVHNIECIVEGLGLDLYTEVINWSEMKDLQLAFFKAAVPHLDIPQDHAFFATMYKFAKDHGIKYILNGGNYATECVRNPLEWIYYGTDLHQIRDIHQQFGARPLKNFPFTSVFNHKIYLRYIRGVKVIKPLDYLPYSRQEAIATLEAGYGWRAYPQKHFESRFTRFYEGFWMPAKFGFDTRKVQYSSLIQTGQMERDEAIERLKQPALDDDQVLRDFEYVASKLDVSNDEMLALFELPNKTYQDYRNVSWVFDIGAFTLKKLGIERNVKR